MAYGYPYGNGQQLNLDWFLEEWKNLLAAWEAEKNGIDGALQAEIDRAEAALADVFAARDAAAQSASNADASERAAAQSASDASGYLSTVQQNATAAQDAARNAAQSESNAADSAQTALASKNAAGQSERNAAQSENNADASKRAAAQSAADALANKDAAAQSAADALANKDAAAQSAEDAEDAAQSVEASAQQIATNTSDIADLKDSVGDIETALDGVYELKSKTNTPVASFDDGADDVLIKKVRFKITPRQSGDLTPSVENAREIIPWDAIHLNRAGKNMFSPVEILNAYFAYSAANNRNIITRDGAGNNKLAVVECAPNTTYTYSYIRSIISGGDDFSIAVFSTPPAIGSYGQRLISASIISSNRNQFTFTTPADAHFLVIRIGNATTTNIDQTLATGQLEIGSVMTEFVEPVKETFDVTLPIGTGDIYGGFIDINEDGSGTLTINQKLASAPLAALSVPSSPNNSAGTGSLFYYTRTNTNQAEGGMISNKLAYVSAGAWEAMPASSMLIAGNFVVFCSNAPNQSIANFTAWFTDNNINYTYYIKNPEIYELTAEQVKTLLGFNNIWANSGDIELLTYRAMNNTSEQIALIKAIIAPVLESMIADTALVVNDFRIVNNVLYRVTANIARGGTLTVGTNVVTTTVAEVLKSLLN